MLYVYVLLTMHGMKIYCHSFFYVFSMQNKKKRKWKILFCLDGKLISYSTIFVYIKYILTAGVIAKYCYVNVTHKSVDIYLGLVFFPFFFFLCTARFWLVSFFRNFNIFLFFFFVIFSYSFKFVIADIRDANCKS